jgi:hypothetical protein
MKQGFYRYFKGLMTGILPVIFYFLSQGIQILTLSI